MLPKGFSDMETDNLTEEYEKMSQPGFAGEASAIYGLQDEIVEETIDALDQEDRERLDTILDSLTAASLADLYEHLDEERRTHLLQMSPDYFTPAFFTEIETGLRTDTLAKLSPRQIAEIISDLDSDDALDMIVDLEPEFQQEIIKKLSPKNRIVLEEGLNFPEESAGRLMQREFVAIPQFWTVGKTIDYLRADSDLPEYFSDLFVITPTYKVAGEIPLNKLIRSPRSEKIENLTLEESHAIPAMMDQEDVALIFKREDLLSAPVVDADERLIGVITVDDVMDVIHEEAKEDFLRLGGVDSDDLYSAVWSTGTARFRWLFVNLLTAILASLVIGMFEATIDQIVALAVLMPIVASMGGNAGTQALTVAVRAIATKQITRTNMWPLIWKEGLVGVLNGLAFAIIMGVIAMLWFGNVMLGLIIAAAMIINLFVAGFCGAGIPILLQRVGSDPAVSSSVFLTTVTDIVGFFAFLGLAALLLPI